MTEIAHVSDTALWVATYRAQESERPDAAFRDPLARKLVGTRGPAIAAAMPQPKLMQFVLTVRTTAIDRLVLSAIEQGIDAVVNLGAGLDTRPYRMQLPKELRWVEVDFAPMIDYKNEVLRDDVPVCRLERIACDLASDDDRRALLARMDARHRNVLVITEGVIAYLSADEARTLARDLLQTSCVQYWIMDYRQGDLNRTRVKKLAAKLKNAPFRFRERNPLAFFGAEGWRIGQDIRIADEAQRIGRRPPFMFPSSLIGLLAPGWVRAKANATYGYVMFTRRP